MKKLLIIGLAMVLVFSFAFVSPSYANGLLAGKNEVLTQPNDGLRLELDDRTENFLKEFTTSGIMEELSVDNVGNMILLNDNVNYLKNKYNISVEFLKLLNAVIDDANAKGLTKGLTSENLGSFPTPGITGITKEFPGDTVSPMVEVKDWKVYFTLDEVKMYFFAAASTGPVALAAALDSVAFLLGGPVSATIAIVLSIIGAATLVNLCYLITQAVVLKKGIYIGITWNGAFPNYTQGTW